MVKYRITDPVPQSSVPPHNLPGFSSTVWKDGVMLVQVGGGTQDAARRAAHRWISENRGHKHQFKIISEPGQLLIVVRCECGTEYFTARENLQGLFSPLVDRFVATRYYNAGWINNATFE